LESQLANQQEGSSAANGAAGMLQQREAECLELHRKLEVSPRLLIMTRDLARGNDSRTQMQQQQLEDMALENKMLLQVCLRCHVVADCVTHFQAVSHKAASSEPQPVVTSNHNRQDEQQQQQMQQQQQHQQESEIQIKRLEQELSTCRSQLSSANAAASAATEALTQHTSSAAAAAAAAIAAATAAAAEKEAQTLIISRLEGDILRLTAEAADAKGSMQAALSAAAAQDAEMTRLRGMLAAAEASAKDGASSLMQQQQQQQTLQKQLQQLTAQASVRDSLVQELQGQLQQLQHPHVDTASTEGNAEVPQLEQLHRHTAELSQRLASQALQLEAAAAEHSAKEQQHERQEVEYQKRIGQLQQQMDELRAVDAAARASLLQEQLKVQSQLNHMTLLQQQVEQLQHESQLLKDASTASALASQVVSQERDALALKIEKHLEEAELLRGLARQQQEAHGRVVAELEAQCVALEQQTNKLQAENDALNSNLRQQQPKNDGKELAAAKRELDVYAQAEGKLLLELNRRLGLAKRCAELGQTSLAMLGKCMDVGVTPTSAVEEQPGAAPSPSALLSLLGRHLDHLVVKLMDVKKASEALSSSVPAMRNDCDRLMAKIVELERMRAEWSESQGELLQTKAALAKQLQQQQAHSQMETSVLSILQSCGGASQGEQLQQAAVRIAEELKTVRMTVSELARQVEVERSSSGSRTRAADSQGSELRASLLAAEQRHAAELSSVKAQLRKSELQFQQVSLDLQAALKLNAELNEQVSVFESVLADKDAEVADVSQQLQLARALVTSLNEQAEVAVNLELVHRSRERFHSRTHSCHTIVFAGTGAQASRGIGDSAARVPRRQGCSRGRHKAAAGAARSNSRS
jgi:hypothetical protein